MKVPNKILNIGMRMALSPDPNITPVTKEEKEEFVKWPWRLLRRRRRMGWPEAFRDVGIAFACAVAAWAFFKMIREGL
jgi:hypothetical protein